MAEAIIIDWYGPFDSKTALREEGKKWDDGICCLYMGVQKHSRIGYIGMTEKPKSRFDNHEKLAHPDNTSFYLGEITTRGASGRRKTKHRKDHAAAEHALIAFLKPRLNSNLSAKDLTDCCVVFSRFFKPGGNYDVPVDVLPKFPRVLAYDSWREQFYIAK